MLSMIPGLKLQGPLVVTPLVNIVLLARDLLQHNVEPVTALWVVISTGLFALAAIGVAARIFGTDAILYGSHGTWSDLFRRPRRVSAAPTATSGLLGLAIIFPTYFLASNLLSRSTLVSLDGRLWLAALVTSARFLADSAGAGRAEPGRFVDRLSAATRAGCSVRGCDNARQLVVAVRARGAGLAEPVRGDEFRSADPCGGPPTARSSSERVPPALLIVTLGDRAGRLRRVLLPRLPFVGAAKLNVSDARRSCSQACCSASFTSWRSTACISSDSFRARRWASYLDGSAFAAAAPCPECCYTLRTTRSSWRPQSTNTNWPIGAWASIKQLT